MPSPTGHCRLCGTFGKLSFEHVPPRAAFNSMPVLFSKMEDLVAADFDSSQARRHKRPRGAGEFTLCSRCNTYTGGSYGSSFVDWCRMGMEIREQAAGRLGIIYLSSVRPLAVLKQICTMLFSVNGESFRSKHPSLERFVLSPESKELPPSYRFFTYIHGGGNARYAGVSGKVDAISGTTCVLSEISYPPFGYVATFGDDAPHPDLFEISFFKRFDFQQSTELTLRLPVLETHLPLPGDYRTKKEIARDANDGSIADDADDRHGA